MTCPNCRQDAPTIVRGLQNYCTACGAPRPMMDAPSAVNVAGRTSKIGGGVASVLGWMVLLGGGLTSLLLGLFFGWLFAGSIAGWVVGLSFAAVSLFAGLVLVLGGRRLRKSGEDRAQSAHEQAIFALAAQRGGTLTVADAARALSLPEADADALLTGLAKRADGKVSLEVDDNGGLSYVFPRLATAPGRQRFEVPAPKARVAAPWQEPRVVDAEIVEQAEDEAAEAARGHHRATR